MIRAAQPVWLLLIAGALVGLRLLPAYDPIGRFLRGTIFGQPPSEVTDGSGIQMQALAEEIAALRRELGFKQADPDAFIGADVTLKSADSFRSSLRINRGRDDGLQPDQPVFSQGYMIGVVGAAEPDSAVVILLGDPELKIPAVVSGGSQGLVEAQAGGVVIDKVASREPLAAGLIVKTSGLGGLYPPGLLLGSIGHELERGVFGRYILERPIDNAQITLVQVKVR